MTEREKMIEAINSVRVYGIMRNAFGGNLLVANEVLVDALVEAGIGDVTEWKERAEKEKAEKNKWKCTANDWKQRFESREKQLGELRTTSCDVVIRKNKIISEQKAEIARLTAEVAELLDCPKISQEGSND